MILDLNIIKEFAQRTLNTISRPSKFHFRDRYLHTLRVLKWAERIQELEGGDIEVIRIASILHDIGWQEGENHAITSKRLAEEYLSSIHYDKDKLPIVLEAIENHNSRKTDRQLHIESFIIMDADILDEVGALSIIWDAMAVAYEQEANYNIVYQRIKEYTKELKERAILLRTETGLKFYLERIKLIDDFLVNMEYELGIMAGNVNLNIETSL